MIDKIVYFILFGMSRVFRHHFQCIVIAIHRIVKRPIDTISACTYIEKFYHTIFFIMRIIAIKTLIRHDRIRQFTAQIFIQGKSRRSITRFSFIVVNTMNRLFGRIFSFLFENFFNIGKDSFGNIHFQNSSTRFIESRYPFGFDKSRIVI